MKCTRLNCPMQAGTVTENCGDNCPWKTTAKTTDLISRAAAIDALTDENIEKNFDSVHDGELHRIKRAAIRIIANMPTVDAVPVAWLKVQINEALDDNETELASDIAWLIRKYMNEQEERT